MLRRLGEGERGLTGYQHVTQLHDKVFLTNAGFVSASVTPLTTHLDGDGSYPDSQWLGGPPEEKGGV